VHSPVGPQQFIGRNIDKTRHLGKHLGVEIHRYGITGIVFQRILPDIEHVVNEINSGRWQCADHKIFNPVGVVLPTAGPALGSDQQGQKPGHPDGADKTGTGNNSHVILLFLLGCAA